MILTELFANGDLQWAMHTTMMLDYAYATQVLALQKSNKAANLNQVALLEALCDKSLLQNTAFFYNSPSSPIADCRNSKLPLQNIIDCCFPVKCNKTLHAKISLVCLKDKYIKDTVFYRLGVFSKNATFAGKCLEVGAIFKLNFNYNSSFDDKAKRNGRQLAAFLDTLYNGCNDSGKNWLKKNELHTEGKLYEQFSEGFKLVLEGNESKDASLYFGGCQQERLYEHLQLDKWDDSSIIITPPTFVQTNKNRDFLKNKLYDLKYTTEKFYENKQICTKLRKEWPTSSHAKLYLLKN
ncbi:MAG: hypothetical protein GYA02_11300 [Clostridiaceae bacterium]|nr:hypothetical protein [Clostridiaceae bacterium]